METELRDALRPEAQPNDLEAFAFDVYAPRLTPKGRKWLRTVLNRLQKFDGGELRFGMLTDARIDEWLAHDPRSAVELKRMRWSIEALWRCAYRHWKVCHLPKGEVEVTAIEVPVDRSLRRFFYDVYLPLKLGQCSERTVQECASMLNALEYYSGVEPHFGMCHDEFYDAWLSWLTRARSCTTANKHARMFLALWRYAWRKRQVAELPRDVQMLPEPKKQPEAWSTDEISRLVAAGRADAEILDGIPMSVWWPALLLTLYYSGLRIGALLAAQRSAYDAATGWLTVPHTTQKHRADQRFQLPADARAALDALLRFGHMGQLFPLPFRWRQQAIGDRFARLIARAGLEVQRFQRFHKVRRTCATYIADAAGEEAARLHLGHSAISVTRRYLDERKIRRVRGEDVLPRLPPTEDVA